MSKGRLVVWSHFVERHNMFLRNDQNMYGRFRVDVFKGEAKGIFEHNTRGKFLVHKPAEETRGHRARSFLLKIPALGGVARSDGGREAPGWVGLRPKPPLK